MTVPPLFARDRRAVWAGLGGLALGQALALVAGVAGTRLAFASLDSGAVSVTALCLVAGAAVMLAVLRPAGRLLAERLGQDQAMAIRAALYRQAMDTPPARLASRRRGYLMLRLTGDMTTLKDGVARSLPLVLQGLALIPAGLLALVLIDSRFALAGLALVGLSLAGLAVVAGPLRAAHRSLRQTRARLVTDLAERLPIAPDLARLGRRQTEVARLARAGRALHRKAAARLVRAEGMRAAPGGLAGLCAVAILWDGARRGLPAGEIAAALAAIGVMGHALVDLAGAIDRLAGWQVARAALARHLETAPSDSGPPPATLRLGRAQGRVAVRGLPDAGGPPSLDLARGGRGTLALPDPDRLVRLLSGQETDPAVCVQMDGVALDALSPGTLRRNIGVLTPTPVVLKGTVRRNLCLGLSDRPSDATLTQRITRAGLAPALAHLGGLDGRVPEAARALPAADRMRLSALRAAVQRPRVLVVNRAALPLPEEVEGFVARCGATVIEARQSLSEAL